MDAVQPGGLGDVTQALREVEDAVSALESRGREVRYWSNAILFPGAEPVLTAFLKRGFAPQIEDEAGDARCRWGDEVLRTSQAHDVWTRILIRLETIDLNVAAAIGLALAMLGITLAVLPRPLLVSPPTSAEAEILLRTRDAGLSRLIASRHDALALIRRTSNTEPQPSRSVAVFGTP